MATEKGAIKVARSASTLTNGPTILVEKDNPVGQLNKTLQTALEHSGPKLSTGKSSQTGLCYILVEQYKNEMMTLLVPCQGKLNKAGTAILGFDQFLSSAHKHYKGQLSEDQKKLNQLCYQIRKLSEKRVGTFVGPKGEPINPARMTALLNLWRQAVCLLQHQPFLFHYLIYDRRELKGIPRKKRLTKIQVSAQAPTLGFELTQHQGVYKLDLRCLINGKWETEFYTNLPYFIYLEDRYYLLSSVQDAGVAQWMEGQKGMIIIASEDYSHFKTHILSVLKQHYPVEER